MTHVRLFSNVYSPYDTIGVNTLNCFLYLLPHPHPPLNQPQVYIRNCGFHRIEIGHQMFVMRRLESVAEAVVLGDSKEERKRILKERLSEIVLPTTFKLPLSPHLNVSVCCCGCIM